MLNLKKINNNTYYIGDYLVKEEFKFEGGGVVNRFCVQYICNKLDIKYLTSDIKYSNTRTFRSGKIGELISREIKDETFSDTIEIFDFFNKKGIPIKMVTFNNIKLLNKKYFFYA